MLLTACGRHVPELHRIQGEAQGTSYHVSYWSEDDLDDAALAEAFAATLKEIDASLSTYRTDSWLARFNQSQSTAWQKAPREVIDLMGIADDVHRQSHGCYDPTIAPLFELWGFQNDRFQVPANETLTRMLERVGFEHLHVDTAHGRIRKDLPGLSIDFSSMGEGYTIRRLADVLEAQGIIHYLIEFGGDLYARGHKPDGSHWRIAIMAPEPGQMRAQKFVTLTAEKGISLDTSGTYRRFFTDNGQSYGHIIDARSGHPVTHDLVSVSVFGTTPPVSDAWATAMLCLGQQEGMQVAKALQLPVYFIEKQGSDLRISQSPALERSVHVSIDE
ncbi:FAD:protein FMN transferase [Halomonas shantousis]